MAASLASPSRFVAIVVRKYDALVGAVDAEQRVALAPYTTPLEGLEGRLAALLGPGDAVVLASRTNAWQLHDTLAPFAASVIIAQSQVETLLPTLFRSAEPGDLLKLACLHAAGLVPALWVPPHELRELRALTGHRRRLILQHAEAAKALESILHRYHLTPPGTNRLGSDWPAWWATQALTARDHACARDSLASLNRATYLLADVEERLRQHSTQAPWQEQVDRLMARISMRRIYAIVLLAAIGDITRFPSANHLAGYARLAGNHQPDSSKGAGSSAKEGWGEIRATMLDVAEAALRDDPHWREVYGALEQRVGPQRAIVAVARKLLVVVWRTLSVAAANTTPAAKQAARRAA